ncbi:MAG: hypothetical protein HKP61_22420 [Dactylosporangium sp.]|nr:hypothetical protein [Dactylosporangium sp.]NNJ63632.1 hypothetical protein [Dactylosporangium sp.]
MTEVHPGVRHPQDPDPTPSTKAKAVLGLGAVALVTAPLLGGVVPATVALLLAREARADLLAANGFLLGGQRLRTGVRLAWAGIVVSIAALTVVAMLGLLTLAEPAGGQDFDPTVN